ncbi:gliding motility protein GldN [Ferruginibacter lapsinanis]|uniref:type IX secretion system ring protein PorN/GldN n=1 Tax=Ferruginibacter lapsinanis TaxID=563172 RepID=UPI001E5DC2E0|nr:gliding motility protein GldN [Ferruginibacter lapsinanis]UEG51159.1 gliding motility protein GldN [Ferruginibacter lapsinanis]
MKKHLVKYFLISFCLCLVVNIADAQKKGRSATKRTGTTTRKTTKSKTKAKISPTASVDSLATAVVAPAPAAAPPTVDSLPIRVVKKSLRRDEAVDSKDIKDRLPLDYEHLRVDDAVYRQKIWREIDAREKINLPFMYAADENNGNQRFISILMKAIQDSAVTVFDAIDDRFTTPLTISQVAQKISGGKVSVPIFDSLGVQTGTKEITAEVNLDSFYKFRIKEEVVFDKEASRLFWRILGIAPVKSVVVGSTGVVLGETELFWVYYPDMRPIFAKYEIYNGKNFGARMSWEELFESRMFSGRIIKSTIDNPFDRQFKEMPGLKENGVFQLLEGERIKEKIFNYEQDLWSY